MSDEKLQLKDYSTHAPRVLNRLIKIRMRQLENLEKGQPTSDKTLAQLRYELNMMTNALMERSMTKVSDHKSDT